MVGCEETSSGGRVPEKAGPPEGGEELETQIPPSRPRLHFMLMHIHKLLIIMIVIIIIMKHALCRVP